MAVIRKEGKMGSPFSRFLSRDKLSLLATFFNFFSWHAYDLRSSRTPDLFRAPILAQEVSVDKTAPVTLQDQDHGTCF